VELTLRQGLLHEDDGDAAAGPVHLTLLAESERGYANLCRLVSLAHRVGRAWSTRQAALPAAGDGSSTVPLPVRAGPPDALPPLLDPALLAGRTEGIIALSGCRSGEASRLVDAGRLADAADALDRLASLFGRENTYVELQQNLVYGDTQRMARLVELAERLRLPYVATGNVHYHDRSRHRLQDALVAIKHRTTLEGSHRLRRPNGEFYLRPPEQTAELFARYPAALANAEEIADRCQGFNMADRRDLGYDFPDFTRQEDELYASADEVLATYCWARFWERYPADETPPEILELAREQLAEELRLVAKHHLAGFFLIYRDLQRLATEVAARVRGEGTIRGGSGLPPGRGRGSSVSSIICYLIGLSHVDPLRPGFGAPPR
jgi:error-prone DNA polymerase